MNALSRTLLVWATLLAAPLDAQHPAADSASTARAAWRRAVAASKANDVALMRREVDRAAAAWPTQAAYSATRARLAARAGDTTTMLDALARIADLGLGIELARDTSYSRYRSLPVFTALATMHAANIAPMARSTVRATLADSTTWPEGIDVDRPTGRLYVGSIRHRTIVERSTNGAERELIPRNTPGIGAVLGVHVDANGQHVWATTGGVPQMNGYVPADSLIAGLLFVRIADGVIERRWSLPPSARGHTLGDVTQGPEGTVYLTDSVEPVLYRLRKGADSLEVVRSPLFNSLQGIAPTPDGRAVYLADYSHGLLRFDVATNATTRVVDAPWSTSLGCDGIAWYDNAIIAIQNGVSPARVMRFTLDRSGSRIEKAQVLDRNIAVADEPTIGTIVGSEFLYVANSQWEKHDAQGARLGGAALSRPVILALPLR